MPSERLALYTTVYPGVERFLPDWYESVQAQTDGDFDIWIGLDGLAPAAVSAIIGAETGIHWVPAPVGASPAQVRAVAIEAMVARYSGVLFVDSDDVLLPTRGAAARTALAEADVGGCALELMDANGTALDAILGVPASSDAVAMLPRCNVFGLSNTVYRSDVLRGCLPVPDDCILVDWSWAPGPGPGGKLASTGARCLRD